MSDKDLYRLALSTYGPDAQTVMVFRRWRSCRRSCASMPGDR